MLMTAAATFRAARRLTSEPAKTDINGELGQADVAIIFGANHGVNPAALTKARSTACPSWRPTRLDGNGQQAPMPAGYAGLDNELFSMDESLIVFGDAKKVVDDMVRRSSSGGVNDPAS